VADFISPTLVMGFDYLAADRVDELMTQSVAGTAADLPEGYLLFRGDRRVKRNRAGNERELEIALPVRTSSRQRVTPTHNKELGS
jgi:hypothetical protein